MIDLARKEPKEQTAIELAVDPAITGAISSATQVKWQRKNISLTLAATTVDIASLRFSNLVIGKTYRLTMMTDFNILGTSVTEQAKMEAINNSVTILTNLYRHDAGTDSREVVTASTLLFTAAGTVLSFNFTENGTTQLRIEETKVILEELPNHTETTDFT